MPEKTKKLRLLKALKEIGIGMDTAIDFLQKNGVDIDKNPNAKISGEEFNLLLGEFQTDKKLKQESEEITTSKIIKESVVIEADAAVASPATDAEGAKEPEENDEKLKRDLNLLKKEAAEKEQPVKKTATKKKIETKTKLKEADTVKSKVKGQKPKVVGKIDLEDEPKAKKKTAKKVAAKKENKVVEEKKTTVDEVEKIKEEDIKSIEKLPVSKDKENIENENIDQKESPFRVDRGKLSGPTIVGKIDLPAVPEKKKPVASSSTIGDEKRKKRRKRKEKKVNINAAVNERTSANTGRKPGQRGTRKAEKHTRVEPTEKEIQDQIKATLARLSGGGKKTKGSKYRKEKRELRQKEVEESTVHDNKNIEVTEFVSANELATLMDVSVTEVISKCMELGLFVSINQRLDAETLSLVAEAFGYKIDFVSVDVQEAIQENPDDPDLLITRAPIITVMGHVDHGKTSLLDHIRKANVIAGEAGGITQHIGAYEVTLDDKRKITFLDTPGHEAFTAMRARGAKVTDVAVIVIAADDSVMPQTVEAINHAQAAGVPIVIAINKIDKPGAQPEKIKEQLSNMNILVEDWGGDYQCQAISAKQGLNVNELLEKVLIQAEMLELKANPEKNAIGTIIESTLDKGRGYVTTILVQAGTIKIGDIVLAGCYSGRVKALTDERGNRLESAGPSQPVIMLGLPDAPQAGDQFNIMDDEREAREIANKRLQLQREQNIRTHKHITLDEIGRRLAVGNFKELNLIIKGDVDGSVEAISDSLLKLSTDEIQVNVIHKSVGAISESDVLLATASEAIIIGFQVRPSVLARKLAEQEQIDIRLYSIIYDAINEVKDAMEGMLAPDYEEKILCNIDVREVFKIPKAGMIAGCMVLDGKVTRNTKVRVIRDGIVAYTGELSSLKRFKDDVKEVATGYECGVSIANFNDIKVGDIIEGYEQVAVKRTLA
jgi:translation initiation factor IF-2